MSPRRPTLHVGGPLHGLSLVTEDGYYTVVRVRPDQGVVRNDDPDVDAWTPLLDAVETYEVAMVGKLLAAPADVRSALILDAALRASHTRLAQADAESLGPFPLPSEDS